MEASLNMAYGTSVSCSDKDRDIIILISLSKYQMFTLETVLFLKATQYFFKYIIVL